MKVSTLILVAAAGLTRAKTIKIDSGPGLYFKPDEIKADVGDILEFAFLPVNHSVAQGSFDKPCQALEQGGFMSGYWPVTTGKASQAFRVRVNDTNPLFFYCTQPFHAHCVGGMVGVVNPSGDKSLAAYKKKTADFTGAPGEPLGIFGGELVPLEDGTSSSGAASSSVATSTSGASSTSVPASPTSTGASSVTSAAPSATVSRAAAGTTRVTVGAIIGALALAIFGLA